MEKPLRGEVVVVRFPFSDFSDSKRRPALVIASLPGRDSILCQITSQKTRDSYSIPLSEKDFSMGSLHQRSNVRPNKLFTADNSIILYRAGTLGKEKTAEIVEKICSIIREA
ncbi:MAG: type II toxin-antitoxin system PemK/MazF family toxin [archaeon]|nr:type II toxin-antitoxin system PemK/MazF family toxin [archaeon]